jgi:hypothetical protein
LTFVPQTEARAENGMCVTARLCQRRAVSAPAWRPYLCRLRSRRRSTPAG